jgi:predicted dehydrogenase
MKQISMIVIGAGSRGWTYADYATAHPDQAKVVGVAEPRYFWRDRMAQVHAVPPKNVFTDWRPVARRKRFADAVLICTLDRMHVEPAVAFARKGYHILCEKPMGTQPRESRRIAAAVAKAGGLFAVGHVMRYTDYTQKLKGLLDSGAIGDLVCLQHYEPVGYWHQAHSFVRGNYRNEGESSSMLLAKSCHDIDWIFYFMGGRCEAVSSFGSLYHFRKDRAPAGAADRCLDCPVEAACPYSAKRFYLGLVTSGKLGWPLDMLTPDLTVEGVTEALRTGPYGRCVYACDNDVVDNQVVDMLFDGGRTASFTMTAFNRAAERKTRLFGTRGELYGDGHAIEHFDFLTEQTQTIETREDASIGTFSHGGGDYRLMQSFVAAVATGDASKILSGAEETLASHLAVFAAEKARREGRVVKL